MNKDKVIYQLKQEAIATLESADETRVHEATGGNPTEESDGITACQMTVKMGCLMKRRLIGR